MSHLKQKKQTNKRGMWNVEWQTSNLPTYLSIRM